MRNIMLVLAVLALPSHAPACETPDGTATVVEIVDGETLILDDGRSLRLAEVLTPWRQDRGGVAVDLRGAMEQALRGMVLGKAVRMKLGPRDRYGRIIAHVALEGDGGWVQERLVAAGLARAAASAAMRPCARALQLVEQKAREARAGLWRDGLFRLQPAEATAALLGQAATYQIVEGTVTGVARVRDRIYINFGSDWRQDFTAGLKSAALNEFTKGDLAAGEGLAGLKGAKLRVRGWIETYNGPFMTLTHPEQIERLTPAGPESGGQADISATDEGVSARLN